MIQGVDYLRKIRAHMIYNDIIISISFHGNIKYKLRSVVLLKSCSLTKKS